MKLIDSKGRMQGVSCGLVDNDGMFLLLLDDNVTKHFKFSDEHELIEDLMRELDGNGAKQDRLSDKIILLERRVSEWKSKAESRQKRIDHLEEKLRRIAGVVE